MRVAVLIGAAWPDNDASGPVQSVRAICTALAGDIHFDLFARAGAPGEAPIVPHGTRRDMPWGSITYCTIGTLGATDMVRLVRGTNPDRLWLNSVWDREFSLPALAGRQVGIIPRVPTLLSTRGEFSAGALAIHAGRKRVLRRALEWGGLLGGVTLHATSAQEADDVRRAFPGRAILLADNVRVLDPLPPHVPGSAQALRAAFLGRISPVKGLHNALSALNHVTAPVDFTIWGPVHDADYWAACQGQIAALPAHVRVTVAGPIANTATATALAGQDLFLNPSASENFGHTIVEALMAGTPVVTGLHTPWNGLADDQAGFNVASDDHRAIAGVIDRYAALAPSERAEWRAAARARAERFAANQQAIQTWRDWFVHTATKITAA